jgi:hypothetical protein
MLDGLQGRSDNFAHVNGAMRMSSAMATCLTETLWDIGDIVKLLEDWEGNEKAA